MNAKNRTKVISDPKLDKVLLRTTGRTLEELIALAKEDDELKVLNEYRGALSLWAEHTNDTKQKIIVTLDGRDTAGKGSNIKRVTEYFDLKRHNVYAYGIPTPEERIDYNWFKRYRDNFPNDGQVSFFDRSWYNRAGVEAAMGFCTQEEYDWFMQNVASFEKEQIIDEGIKFIKIYLTITKASQKERLVKRESARRRWKSSPIDKAAQEKWNYYTRAKAKILELTDSEHAPWTILDSNERWLSAIEIIKAIINTTSEVAKLVEQDLSLDLSPNRNVRRTATEELKIMEERGYLEKMKSEFNFRAANDEEIAYVENFRATHKFDRSSYSYVTK